jgi:microcompartment protein CcmK/EutM
LTKTLKSIRGYLKRKQKVEAAGAVMCAILNSMTQGIAGSLLQSAMGETLGHIVDFLDIDHIAAVASLVKDVTVQESLTSILEKTTHFASDQTEAAIDQAVIQLADNLENDGHHRTGDEALLTTLVLTSKLITIAAADSQVGSTRSTSLAIKSMGAGEIKKELASYGISTKAFLEKKELVEALQKARINTLRADEIKKELESHGICNKAFLEKKELVKALQKARASAENLNSKKLKASAENLNSKKDILGNDCLEADEDAYPPHNAVKYGDKDDLEERNESGKLDINACDSNDPSSLPTQGAGIVTADSKVTSTRPTIVVRVQHLEESFGIDEGSGTSTQPKPTILNRISYLEENVLG